MQERELLTDRLKRSDAEYHIMFIIIIAAHIDQLINSNAESLL